MESIKQFIVDNWQFISFGLVVLFELLILIFKKKNKTLLLDNSAYSSLVRLVKEAEEKFGSGSGEDKLRYVISNFLREKHIGNLTEFNGIIKAMVDDILECPTKKGGYGRESK